MAKFLCCCKHKKKERQFDEYIPKGEAQETKSTTTNSQGYTLIPMCTDMNTPGDVLKMIDVSVNSQRDALETINTNMNSEGDTIGTIGINVKDIEDVELKRKNITNIKKEIPNEEMLEATVGDEIGSEYPFSSNSLHNEVENWVLPVEILRMDDKSIELYKQTLEDGKVAVHNIRVMVVGHFGVGKTALTRRLLEKDVDLDIRESTDGIKVYVRRCQVSLQDCKWTILKKDTKSENALKRLAQVMSQQTMNPNSKDQSKSSSSNQKMDIHSDLDTKTTEDPSSLVADNDNISQEDNLETLGTNMNSQWHTLKSMNTNINSQVEALQTKGTTMNSQRDTIESMGTNMNFPLEAQEMMGTNMNSQGDTLEAMGTNMNSQGEAQEMMGNNMNSQGDTLEAMVTNMNSQGEAQDMMGTNMNSQGDTLEAMGTNMNSQGEAQEMMGTNMNSQELIKYANNLKHDDLNNAELSIWDFAGQSVFYSTHQVFLSHRAVYLLVTDISKHIQDVVVEDEFCFDSTGSKYCSITEYVEFWLNSIHGYCASVKKGVPPVILVGTHADKLDQENQTKLSEHYFEALRNVVVDQVTHDHLVDKNFAINNTIIDPKLTDLRNKIFKVASEQQHWGELIPARWITLEKALIGLEEKGLKICTKESLKRLNQSLPVPLTTDDELCLFLRFQHDTGNIIYFRDAELCDHILLDPQWLVDAFKCLITAKMFVKNKPIYPKWRQFNKTAILTYELIDALWTPEEQPGFHDHRDQLIALMEMLNMISRPRSFVADGVQIKVEDFFLVPCMLKNTPDSSVLQPPTVNDETSTSIICFTMTTGFIPVAVFIRLMSSCLTQWPVSKQSQDYLIYCGVGVFDVDRQHRLTLFFNQNVIQLWVKKVGEKNPNPSKEVCTRVRKFIEQTFVKIKKQLRETCEFKLRLKCPDVDLRSNSDLFDLEDFLTAEDGEVSCYCHDCSHVLRSSDMLKYWGFEEAVSKEELSEEYRTESDEEENTNWQKALRKCYTKLVSVMEPMSILDHFQEIAFLPDASLRDIRERQQTSDKNRAIIDKVLVKDIKGFNDFKKCLNRTKQHYLANQLTDHENQIKEGLKVEGHDKTSSISQRDVSGCIVEKIAVTTDVTPAKRVATEEMRDQGQIKIPVKKTVDRQEVMINMGSKPANNKPKSMMANLKEMMEVDNATAFFQKEYDVFFIFSEEDKAQAEHICKALERAGIPQRCLASWIEGVFTPGVSTFDNITRCIDKARRTLLILTKRSLTEDAARGWMSLETMLAVEKSVLEHQMILRLLLVGIDVHDPALETYKKGLLENIPEISVSFNKEGWENRLVDSLNKEVKLPDLLPVGSLAHGQVFSHFVGFLAQILPVLQEELKKTKIFQENPRLLSMKYYILIPASSVACQTLDCIDQELKIKVTKQEIFEINHDHAGKPRKYKLTLYQAQKEDEVYYFVGDFPNVLNVIYTMSSRKLAEVDIRFHIARFYYTLNQVVNHAKNTGCKDTVKIIRFNSLYETLADVVFSAARDDVREAVMTNGMANMELQNDQVQARRTPQEIFSERTFSQCTHDCAIVHYSDNERDCQVAEDIKSYLISKDKTVFMTEPGKPIFNGLNNCRWVVFIFSNDALKNDKTMTYACTSVLHESFKTNRLRVLPVLVDTPPEKVPKFIKWVTLVKITEPNYCGKLLQVMNGSEIYMDHHLPAGDVITGLAWAYIINYLPVTLENFHIRMKKLLVEKGITAPCINKMLIIAPKTCFTDHSVIQELNKGYPDDGAPVKYIGHLDPIVKSAGGHHHRRYYLHMFQYTNFRTGKVTCFITEYSTPINCLHEMAMTYSFAGLDAVNMHKQGGKFVKKVSAIVNREAVKREYGDMSGLIDFIQFDDEHQLLLEAFEEQVKFDEVPPSMLVFGEDIQPQGDPNYPLPSMCNR